MRQQTALEFMSTYSFLFIIIAVSIAVLEFIASLPSISLPQTCSSFAGPACTSVIYYSDRILSYSVLTLVITNSEPVPINITGMNVSSKTVGAGACTPSFLYPGQDAVCSVSLKATPKAGALLQGFYSVNAQYCNTGISSLRNSSCDWENVSYGGSFTTYAGKAPTVVLAISAATGPSDSNLLPFSAIGGDIRLASNYTIVQNGYWAINYTANTLGFSFGNGNNTGTNYLGHQTITFPQTLSILNNANVPCVPPYNTTLSVMSTVLYFSQPRTIGVNALSKGAFEVFYRKAGQGNSWQSLFGGSAWSTRNTFQYITQSPSLDVGLYAFKIVWSDTCGAGVQAINFTNLPVSAHYTTTTSSTSTSTTSTSVTSTSSTSTSVTSTTSVSSTTSSTSTSTSVTTLVPSLYCVGGGDSSNYYDSTYYAAITGGGSLGTWVSSSAYPTNIYLQGCASGMDAVYCVGGYNGTDFTNATYYASILSDNTLSAWALSANSYPIDVDMDSCVATQYTVYCIAGQTGAGLYTDSVYYANILPSGDLDTWAQSGNAYPMSTAYHSCTFSSGDIYCVGGYSSGYLDLVYYAPALPSGDLGAWTATNPYPTPAYTSCASTSNAVYCASGYPGGSGATNAVYYAPELSGGGLGTWAAVNAYPRSLFAHSCAATDTDVYCVAGQDYGGFYYGSVYHAAILSNSILGTWTSDYAYPQSLARLSCVTTPTTSTTTSSSSTSITTSTITFSSGLYCVGGLYDLAVFLTNSTYTAPMVSGGFSYWAAGSAYPSNIAYQSCTGTYNSVYCVGGFNDSFDLASVYYANILQSNTLGAWTPTNSYPANIDSESCVSTSNVVYCIGGENGTNVVRAVEHAKVLPAGQGLGTWAASANSYPVNSYGQSCMLSSGRIYCVGGYNSVSNTRYDLAYYAALAGNVVGTWAATNSYPTGLEYSGCASTPNALYCVAGLNDTSDSNAVYYASILSGGALGTWTATQPYPFPVDGHSCGYANGYVRCVGGSVGTGDGHSNLTYYAAVLGDGSLDTWSASAQYPFGVYGLSCASLLTTSTSTSTSSSSTTSSITSTTVSSTTLSTSTSTTTTFSQALYCVAGLSDGDVYADAYYAPILPDNSLGPWLSGHAYPINVYDQQCVGMSDAIYCVPGIDAFFYPTNAVYYAPILSDSTLGPWTATNSLVSDIGFSVCSASQSSVYCVGGYESDTSYTNTVEYASALPGGGLGAWAESSNPYPIAVTNHGCSFAAGYVYCVGGVAPGVSGYLDYVYYAPVLPDNSVGTWAATNSYPIPVGSPGCVSTSNAVYCISGATATSPDVYTSSVYYAPVLLSGGLGAWSSTNAYPLSVIGHRCSSTSNAVYCAAGASSSGSEYNAVYYAQILASGDLGTWRSATNYPIDSAYQGCVSTPTTTTTTSTTSTSTSTSSTTSILYQTFGTTSVGTTDYPNLQSDGGFESGAGPWYYGSFAIVTSPVHSGVNALEIFGESESRGGSISVIPGATYQWGGWCYTPPGNTAGRIDLMYYTNYWHYDQYEATCSGSSSYSRTISTVTLGGSATNVIVRPVVDVPGDIGYFDDVFLQQIQGYAKCTLASGADGTADAVSFYAYNSGNFTLAIYSDSNGPATKLWESASTAASGAPSWQTVNISDGTPTSLTTSASTYWLCWQTDTADMPAYSGSGSGAGNFLPMSYGSFPSAWTGGRGSTEVWSEYVTYH